MSVELLRALKSDDPSDVERLCRLSFEQARESLGHVIPMALSGSRSAAFRYVAIWKELTNDILHAIHDADPDLLLDVDGHLFVVDVKRWPAHSSTLLLEAEAFDAPFSNWIVATDDVGTGACAALVQKVREIVPGLHPIALGIHALPHWEQSEAQIRAFRRNISAAFNESDPPLERIRHVFNLNLTQLGDLFGVTRQAVTQWLESGVPEDRLAKVATVAAIADLFDYRLRSDRIPGVVRREAPAYGGLTALDMIRQDKHDDLLSIARQSFEWSVPA